MVTFSRKSSCMCIQNVPYPFSQWAGDEAKCSVYILSTTCLDGITLNFPWYEAHCCRGQPKHYAHIIMAAI